VTTEALEILSKLAYEVFSHATRDDEFLWSECEDGSKPSWRAAVSLWLSGREVPTANDGPTRAAYAAVMAMVEIMRWADMKEAQAISFENKLSDMETTATQWHVKWDKTQRDLDCAKHELDCLRSALAAQKVRR
jgi:hypothetical protein